MLALYAKCAAAAGIPRIIVHSHCTGRRGWRHSASKSMTAAVLDRYATDYLACSREAGVWRFSASACRENLRVIPDGIDPCRFRYDECIRARMRSMLGIDDNSPIRTILIGCVGRLSYQKNQSFLIELIAKLNADSAAPAIDDIARSDQVGLSERYSRLNAPAVYKLILIGEGEDREMLKALSDSLGVSDHVILTGVQPDTAAYYQAMDVLAVPSRYEGFGMAALEGQAAGLDVILAEGLPEIVRITPSATFVPLEDREAWMHSLAAPRIRRPANADIIKGSSADASVTAETILEIYLKQQDTGIMY